MFEHVKPFPIEGFQKINAEIGDDGLVKILRPDDGDFYHLKYILYTTYITEIEAVNCIRDAFSNLKKGCFITHGFDDELCYGILLAGEMDEALNFIYGIQFHYEELNNYVREAQLIHYNRKKAFQRPDEVRRSIALIGMAYVELAGGPQMGFIPPTEEDIMWMEHAASEHHTSQFIAIGICRMVWDWRREGKTEREIAELLYDDGKWCSLAQIGALLHNDDSRISADSMKKNAARLLGKAK